MTFRIDESLGRLIYKTSLDLRIYVEKTLSPHDVTVEQFHLLKKLSPGEGLNQNELGRRLGKKPANITRLLDRLEKKQWIARSPHPDDRRSSLVHLTSAGARLVEAISRDFGDPSCWSVDGVTPEEGRIFRKVLERIDENICKLSTRNESER